MHKHESNEIHEEEDKAEKDQTHKAFHKKNIKPIGSVFFRFSHRDKNNMTITNKQ